MGSAPYMSSMSDVLWKAYQGLHWCPGTVQCVHPVSTQWLLCIIGLTLLAPRPYTRQNRFSVPGTLSGSSSTSVIGSSITNYLTASFVSSQLPLSSGRSLKFQCRLSVTASSCTWAAVPGAVETFPLRTASKDGWGMSFCVFSTAGEKIYPFNVVRNAASRLSIKDTTSAHCQRGEQYGWILDWERFRTNRLPQAHFYTRKPL